MKNSFAKWQYLTEDKCLPINSCQISYLWPMFLLRNLSSSSLKKSRYEQAIVGPFCWIDRSSISFVPSWRHKRLDRLSRPNRWSSRKRRKDLFRTRFLFALYFDINWIVRRTATTHTNTGKEISLVANVYLNSMFSSVFRSSAVEWMYPVVRDIDSYRVSDRCRAVESSVHAYTAQTSSCVRLRLVRFRRHWIDIDHRRLLRRLRPEWNHPNLAAHWSDTVESNRRLSRNQATRIHRGIRHRSTTKTTCNYRNVFDGVRRDFHEYLHSGYDVLWSASGDVSAWNTCPWNDSDWAMLAVACCVRCTR